MPQRYVFCAAHGCGKTHRLALAARDALHHDRAPDDLLALSVHQVAANVLRDTLKSVVGQDVPATTVRRRAQHLLHKYAPLVHLPAGWEPSALLSGIDRRLLIHQAWAGAGTQPGSLYARHGEQPGALDWITRLFDRFADWAGTADPRKLPRLSIDDAALHEMWQAYSAYLQLCRQHGLVAFAEVFNRAADALRHPSARREPVPRVLLLDDLDLFQPAELNVVAALLGPETDVLAAVSDMPQPHSPVALERHLAQWLDRLAAERIDCGVTERSPEISVGEYAAPDDEAHAIAQRIAAATEHNRRFEQYAIVTFDQALAPLLRRILPQYGLLVEGAEARNAYSLLLAQPALAGIKLIAEQAPSLHEISALLRHNALGLSPLDAQIAIDAITQHGMKLEQDETPRWPLALSDPGRARLQALHAATVAARRSRAAPSVQLRWWLQTLDLEARCWTQTEAALGEWAVEIDQRHWERWLGFLKQSEALHGSLGLPLTAADAVDILLSAQALVEEAGKPEARAVQIWQATALGGCTADTVFIAGLHESALPQPLPPLPFATDDQLVAAFGALPCFVAPQIDDRAAAWQRGMRDLRRVIGRANHAAHLSYSRTDRQEHTRLPSPVLAAYLDARLDRQGRLAAPNVVIETAPLADVRLEHAALIARHRQYARNSMLEAQPPLEETPLPESPFRISPSAIEDYFTCPRRCFYARQLRLYDVASSPRQALGHIVHAALDDLLHEADVFPPSEERAHALVERHWIDDVQRWGSRLKQAVFKQLAQQAVANLARYEADHGSTTFIGGEMAFEWAIAGTDVVLHGRIDRIDRAADGLHVVDYKLGQHNPSIASLLTEFVQPDDAAWRPGDIQLPVYALALEGDAVPEVAGERVSSVALLYPLDLYTESGKRSSKGRREITVIDHDENCAVCNGSAEARQTGGTICRQQLAATQQHILAAVAAMRAGHWEADPREGSKTCASCPFRPICSAPQ